MNPESSVTIHVADALAASGIPYLLTGSFASNYYGIPRSTKDADFVMQLAGGVGAEFGRLLGDEFILDPQLSFETVTGTYRQYIRHRTRRFKIELFVLSNDDYDQERFRRKREGEIFGHKIWLLSPEDVVVSKLRWARSKDEDDVKNVMTVQNQKLDWNYIENWCRKHGTIALMQKIRQSIPEIE
jgi:hypothetical protein